MNRRTAIKAALASLAGGVACGQTGQTGQTQPILLPVTRHQIGACRPDGGDICNECYDLMTDDFENALDPIIDKAVAAFWVSVKADLPFFKPDDKGNTRMGNDQLFGVELWQQAKEAVADDLFEQWQRTPEAEKIRARMQPLEFEDGGKDNDADD